MFIYIQYPLDVDFYHFNDHDIFWDGSGCPNGTCCGNATQPWFYREPNVTTSSGVEARLCSVHGFDHKAVLIDQLQKYIQQHLLLESYFFPTPAQNCIVLVAIAQ